MPGSDRYFFVISNLWLLPKKTMMCIAQRHIHRMSGTARRRWAEPSAAFPYDFVSHSVRMKSNYTDGP
jgi:hypothetical protein